MAEMFEVREPEKRGINTGLLVGVLVALALLGGVAWWLSRTPPIEDQTAKLLEGSLTEGSPEFSALAKNIQIARDNDRTVESPTGMGTISMFIYGHVYNRTGKRITLLQVEISVIDQQNKPIQSKRVLVVPVENPVLEPGGTVAATCSFTGFDRKDDRANINFKVVAIKVEG